MASEKPPVATTEALLGEIAAPAVRFKPYPAYTDSRVEWLAQLPAHWATPPLYSRYLVELGKMLDESRIAGEYLVPYLRNVDVQWDEVRHNNLPSMDISVSEYQRYTVREGDLLVCEGGEVGRAAIVGPVQNVLGYQKALHRLRARSSDEVPRYMYYTLRWATSAGVFDIGRVSTIAHLTAEQLRRYRFPRPAMSEQRTIVAFLDRETAKIDALVAKKERMTELLQEKRAALVTEAVTRGLDSTVPMKDSGIEWLGRIPAHWEARVCGWLFVERDERDRRELPILEVSIESGVSVRKFSGERIEQKASDPATYKVARTGDIAFNKMRAWQGAIGVAPLDGLVSPDYTVAKPSGLVNARYASQLLRTDAYKTEINRLSHGIVDDRNRLYWNGFKRIALLLPPRIEQDRIMVAIESETAKVDALIARIREGIEHLKEYRTALISAAVTGKIDVREAA